MKKLLPILFVCATFVACKNNTEKTAETTTEATASLEETLPADYKGINFFKGSFKDAPAKAKAENKVILVSIGYAACHWCHVMEKESFENEATAAIMNEYFINIKIDREERPDVDHIYMDAVQAITGSGGWPLNVFLTPDAKPFYGGTYFFNHRFRLAFLSGKVFANFYFALDHFLIYIVFINRHGSHRRYLHGNIFSCFINAGRCQAETNYGR